MFAIDIFFDVLSSLSSKKTGSSRRTESRPAEPASLPLEPPAKSAESPYRPPEPPPGVAVSPSKSPEPAAKSAEPPPKPVEPPAKPAKPAAKPDDLRRIEGIGPKISRVLVDAGVTTFSQLASTPMDQLREILADAGLGNLVDPSSWPEQARLAAAEDWDAFQKLKDDLSRGRRV